MSTSTSSTATSSTAFPSSRSSGSWSARPLRRLALALILIAALLTTVGVTSASAVARVSVNRLGDLTINGTNAADQISIWTEPNGHTGVRVRSGGNADVHYLSDVTRDVIINLRGGNDLVLLSSFRLPRDVKINDGNGSNQVIVEFGVIGRDLRMRDGSGASSVYIEQTDIGRNGQFTLGSGLSKVEFIEAHWAGSSRVTTSSRGTMEMRLSRTTVRGPFTLVTGNQPDVVEIEKHLDVLAQRHV